VKEILDELWNRHYPRQVEILHVKLCRICPPEEPDRDGFAAECTKNAYTAFLRRTYSRATRISRGTCTQFLSARRSTSTGEFTDARLKTRRMANQPGPGPDRATGHDR